METLEKVAADAAAAAIYDRLLEILEGVGPFVVEPGKASILVRNRRAVLGVHPRRGALLVNIVTAKAAGQ